MREPGCAVETQVQQYAPSLNPKPQIVVSILISIIPIYPPKPLVGSEFGASFFCPRAGLMHCCGGCRVVQDKAATGYC